MDPRLIPINGLLALLTGDGGWPAKLSEQALQRHMLEAPVATSDGPIRADAVIFRLRPPLALLVEAKSGRNLEPEQAQRYATADALALRRVGSLPSAFIGVEELVVRPLFVVLDEHRADIECQLADLAIEAPVLSITGGRAQLTGGAAVGLADFDERHEAGLPPARMPVDHQSPDEAIREVIVPRLVAAQARGLDVVGVEDLCQQALPEWPVLGAAVRRDFVKRADRILRDVAKDAPRAFRFEPKTEAVGSRVIVLQSPAGRRPQGRTQAWQAQQRKLSEHLGRARQPADHEQLSLDDLAQEGGLADE